MTEIEYWRKERFRDRQIKIIDSAGKLKVIFVPDDEVICDLCNAKIEVFPVAVYRTYALCENCLKELRR